VVVVPFFVGVGVALEEEVEGLFVVVEVGEEVVLGDAVIAGEEVVVDDLRRRRKVIGSAVVVRDFFC